MNSQSIDEKLAAARLRYANVSGEDSVVDAAFDSVRLLEEVLSDPAASSHQRAIAISGIGDAQSLAEVYGDDPAPSWVFYALAAILDPNDSYKLVSMAAEMSLALGTKRKSSRILLSTLIAFIQENYDLPPEQQRTLDQVAQRLE